MATTPNVPSFDEGHAQAEVRKWVSPHQAREIRGIARVHQRMRKTKWDPITLVNMHGWALHVSGYIHKDLRLPGAPPLSDEEAPKLLTADGREITYALHVFADYSIDGLPNESGDRTFEEILPVEKAVDCIRQHNNSMRNLVGGLFCYAGALPPNKSLDAEAYIPDQNTFNALDAPRMSVRDAIEKAFADQVNYYMKMLDEAEKIAGEESKGFRKGQRRSEIQMTTRKIVEWMRHLGFIDAYPEWFTVKRTGKNARPPRECPSCGQESKPKARRCTNGTCTYVFDPFEAFMEFVIGIDTPGAQLAFRRLEREQIVALLKARIFSKAQLIEAGWMKEGKNNEEKES